MSFGFSMGDEAFDLPAVDVLRVFETAAGIGATRFRVEISWSDTNPTRGQYRWDIADRLVNDILRCGMAPLLILFRKPSWANPADYRVWCKAVAARYQPGGAGITADNAGRGVRDYELWNEPNHWMYLPNTSGSSFTTWLQAGYTGVKEVLPGGDSTVVLGGLMQTGNFSLFGIVTVAPDTFLTQVYKAGGRGYFDAVGNHPYTTEESSVAPTLGSRALVVDSKLRDIMVSNGDGALPIWWTELGYPTAMVSETQQLAHTQKMFEFAESRAHVGPVFIYNLRDSPGGINATEKSFGVVTKEFREKLVVPWLRTVAPRVVDVAPPRMEATASMPDPQVAATGDAVDVAPPRMEATASMPDPQVYDGTVEVAAPRMEATASMPAAEVAATQSLLHVFSGSVKPAFLADWGNYGYTVSGGVANNGAPGGSDGRFVSGGVWTTPLQSPHYWVMAQMAADGIYDRGAGAMVAAGSPAVTNCVYAIGRKAGGSPHSTSIYTKIGGAHVERAHSSTWWNRWDLMALMVTETEPGSGVFVYRVYKALPEGGFAEVCSWPDADHLITPGRYAGSAFEHRRSFFGNYSSPGIYAMQINDII